MLVPLRHAHTGLGLVSITRQETEAMDIPFAEILRCVNANQDPLIAFTNLVSIGRSTYKSPVWDSVPEIDIPADILAAQQWLKKEAADSSITGIYLGLDTLNENEGTGKNIEMGFTRDADPKSLNIEWIYNLTKYGTDHLIRGIFELHTWYESDAGVHADHDDKLQLLLDYIFFLGYSGVILAAAIQKERLQNHCLLVWGFHDGDLGPLCRWSPTGFERLADWSILHGQK